MAMTGVRIYLGQKGGENTMVDTNECVWVRWKQNSPGTKPSFLWSR